MILRDIYVDGVVTVGTTDVIHERQVHHLRMLAQPPDVGLVTCQTGAVDTALLTGTDTDGLSVLHVADRVRLGIFQGDKGDDQVAFGLWGKGLVLGGHILEEGIVVEFDLVTALLKGDAEHLLALDRLRHVGRINLNHIIGTLALILQDLDSLRGEVWGDHTVAYFTLQQFGGGGVAGVRERHKVTVTRHTVSTTGTGVGTGDGTLVETLHVVHEVDLLQGVAQGQTYGSTCR